MYTELDEIPDKCTLGKGRYKALSGCNGTGFFFFFFKLQLHDLNVNGAVFRASRVMLGKHLLFSRAGLDSHWIKISLLVQVVYARNFAVRIWDHLRLALGAAFFSLFSRAPTVEAGFCCWHCLFSFFFCSRCDTVRSP